MATKLETALELTQEEHSQAFERFANAFLIPDYPELEGLGGKHDGGMDARLIEESGDLVLVVQTCVSPKGTARTKILKTIKSLKKKGVLPPTLVYCTPAKIGNSLDILKRDLRKSERLALEIHDFAWICQREISTPDRVNLADRYAEVILAPIHQEINPNALYSGVLTEEQQRLAFQYLEAQSLDHRTGSNLTKRVFSGLVVYATRDSDPPHAAYQKEAIISTVQQLFPVEHHQRVAQIVQGRIEHLEHKKILHFNKQAGGYVLSGDYRKAFADNLDRIRDRDAAFRAYLLKLIDQTVVEREIDYSFDRSSLSRLAHSCVFWFMKVQADRFVEPFESISHLIYADKVVDEFQKQNNLGSLDTGTSDAMRDILPHVVFNAVNSNTQDIRAYLRNKADRFITQSFLQVTPDVYAACKNLIGQDIIYLDSSVLIRSIAELYSETGHGPLTIAIRAAKNLGIRFRVWKQHLDEFVTHLRGPVLLEWENNFSERAPTDREPLFWTAPSLVRVFADAASRRNRAFTGLVEEIIGQGNEWENATEFLCEELGVVVEDSPQPDDNQEWQKIFGTWLEHKRRNKVMSDSTFELLVRNDVNAYQSVVQMRRTLNIKGDNYGQKVWLLTFDGMVWRIPKLISHAGEHVYEVAMSLDFVNNYVATAVSTGLLNIPDEALSAVVLIDETESGTSQLREVAVERWTQPGEKEYMRRRRLRDLVHQVKSEQLNVSNDDPPVEVNGETDS